MITGWNTLYQFHDNRKGIICFRLELQMIQMNDSEDVDKRSLENLR